MNIVFCYYDRIEFDARAQDTIECIQDFGKIFFVSLSKCSIDKYGVESFVIPKRNYASFILKCKKTIKNVKPDLVFLHDNYCARLIPFIKKVCPNAVIVYDMSELYIGGQLKTKYGIISKYLLEYAEYKYLHYVDIVIAANEERAYIAKGYYGLNEKPIVFENIHRIDEKYDKDVLDKKYSSLFSKNTFKVVYAGGLSSAQRDIIGLIKSFTLLGDDYELYIAGGNANSTDTINELNKHNNVHYLGKLSRQELKYVINQCSLNVSLFDLRTINTIFCASGKVYEGLFEGLPVLLSPNPPNVRMISDYGIGEIVYEKNYSDCIKKIKNNYDLYKKNVNKYIEIIDYDNRIIKLRTELKSKIELKRELLNE